MKIEPELKESLDPDIKEVLLKCPVENDRSIKRIIGLGRDIDFSEIPPDKRILIIKKFIRHSNFLCKALDKSEIPEHIEIKYSDEREHDGFSRKLVTEKHIELISNQLEVSAVTITHYLRGLDLIKTVTYGNDYNSFQSWQEVVSYDKYGAPEWLKIAATFYKEDEEDILPKGGSGCGLFCLIFGLIIVLIVFVFYYILFELV